MKNLGNNQYNKCNVPSDKKAVVDERFEQNAGVKIHNKQSYSGGSGYYALKSRPECPNVNDEVSNTHSKNSK